MTLEPIDPDGGPAPGTLTAGEESVELVDRYDQTDTSDGYPYQGDAPAGTSDPQVPKEGRVEYYEAYYRCQQTIGEQLRMSADLVAVFQGSPLI
jgi:hypothetical protein